MTTHTIIRWHVTDKRLAHRLRQHCRCWIDTKHGNRIRSVHASGLSPSRRVLADHLRKQDGRSRTAMALARVLSEGTGEIRAMLEDGDITHNQVIRIMGAFKDAADREGLMPREDKTGWEVIP